MAVFSLLSARLSSGSRTVVGVMLVIATIVGITPAPPIVRAVHTEVQLASTINGVSATHRLPIDHSPGIPPESFVIAPADIPEENWHAGHRGVDLQADVGEPIYASRGGTVHFAGVVGGTPVVSVLHSDGVRTTYEPVLRVVSKGDAVRRGDLIGHLADVNSLPETARTSPGLSWGARIGERYIDPMILLGTPQVRLKS